MWGGKKGEGFFTNRIEPVKLGGGETGGRKGLDERKIKRKKTYYLSLNKNKTKKRKGGIERRKGASETGRGKFFS